MEAKQDAAEVSSQQTEGQLVCDNNMRIPRGNLADAEKLVQTSVLLPIKKVVAKTPTQLTDELQKQLVEAIILPGTVQITDLPENITLETESNKSDNCTKIRMRIIVEPKSLPNPETLGFNIEHQYMTEGEGESEEEELFDRVQIPLDDRATATSEPKSISSEETEYFSDMEAEESISYEKAVQTDIALGELLFSESIGSVSSADVKHVGVQTYITAVNVPGKEKSYKDDETADQEGKGAETARSIEEVPNEEPEEHEDSECDGEEGEEDKEEAEEDEEGADEAEEEKGEEDEEAEGEEEKGEEEEEAVEKEEDDDAKEAQIEEFQEVQDEEANISLIPDEVKSDYDEVSFPDSISQETATLSDIEDTQFEEVQEIQQKETSKCLFPDEVKSDEGLVSLSESFPEEASLLSDIEETTEEQAQVQEGDITYSLDESDVASNGIPTGLPTCLLRGNPPWVEPMIDMYTVMWDINLEVAPNQVEIQFRDNIDPIDSTIKISQMDTLQQLKMSQKQPMSIPVKRTDSQQEYLGNFAAPSLSTIQLRRDPELFDIHIDIHTWGFPASLHERYAMAISGSTATLFDDEPSTGAILFMNEEGTSMLSIYNPTSKEDLDYLSTFNRVSVGFITEDKQAPPDAVQPNPETRGLADTELTVPERNSRCKSNAQVPQIPDIMQTSPSSGIGSESTERPRSISEELKSPALSSSRKSQECEEEENLSTALPLALVIAISDTCPLILLLDPGDLPISIAIGTKNVPINNVNALCSIKKLNGNMFRINNIELSETAINNLVLEKTESNKVRCKIKVDGDVTGQYIKDLGSLGSTILLNLPLERAIDVQDDVDVNDQTLPLSAQEENESFVDDERVLPEKDHFKREMLDTLPDNDAFQLQWQEGLPVPNKNVVRKMDTVCLQPEDKFESENILGTGYEAHRGFEEENPPPTDERTKRNSGNKCKTSMLDRCSPPLSISPDRNSPTKTRHGVLAKALKELEQQISPLYKALDDIKCKIEALEVEEAGKHLSPDCSEGSSTLSRCDSGYEQQVAELISSAQRETKEAHFPCMESSCTKRISSCSQIQCMCKRSAELLTPRRRKSCLNADPCSRNRYLIPQAAALNMPLDMGFAYLVPTAIEIVTPATWSHSALYGTPSELGCLGACNASMSETTMYHHLAPKKTRKACSMWTNEY